MLAAGPGGFLGVTRSLLGKRWLERPADDRLALAMAQRLDLPEAVGRVGGRQLRARGAGGGRGAGRARDQHDDDAPPR